MQELVSYSLLRVLAFQLNRASKCNRYIKDTTRFGNILSTRTAESRIKMYLTREGNEFIVARLRARFRTRDIFSEISMQLNRENGATTHYSFHTLRDFRSQQMFQGVRHFTVMDFVLKFR